MNSCVCCENPIANEAFLICKFCNERVQRFWNGGTMRYAFQWWKQMLKQDSVRAAEIFNGWKEEWRNKFLEAEGQNPNTGKPDPDLHKKALTFDPQGFQRDFYFSGAKVKCAFWGNQSGKSVNLANIHRNFVTCDYPDEWPEQYRFEAPTIGRLWIPTFSLVKSVFLPKWIEWLDDWPADHKSNASWQISRNHQGQIAEVQYMANHSMFDVVSSEQFDQNSMVGEGWQGHYAIADEPLRRGAYNATMRGLMILSGQFIFGGTLLTEPWMTRSFVRKQVPGEIECFFASTYDNLKENGGYLSRRDVGLFEADLSIKERKTRIEGTPAAMLGTYFPKLSEPEIAKKIFVPVDAIDPLYEVVSITDYHQSTPIHTIYLAITPWDQMIYFAELIQGEVSASEYVKMMLRTESDWGVNRLRARYVDRTIDVNYRVEVGDKAVLFNPYNRFNQCFTDICASCFRFINRGQKRNERIDYCECGRRLSTPGFIKVSNAQGNIDLVREKIGPVYCKPLEREIQPFLIGHQCEELIETLPDASPSTFRSGPMAGEAKEEMDKRKIKGGHCVDVFLYGMGLQLTYEKLESLPPPPGTYGHLIQQMSREAEDEAMEMVGMLVVS